jgi:gliding motility-associated-like protein
MMGGNFPLVIDSKTGIMTGIPQTLGQFVVGVCIDEYDKVTKALLSQTRRDFQYNVVNCTGSNASFTIAEKICKNTEVIVTRENPEATTYEWYLGEGEDRELISRDFLIKLKFEEVGTYVLTLITDKGQFCESTLSRKFEVIGNDVDFSVQKVDFPCENISRFTLKNLSASNNRELLSYTWNVKYANSLLSSNLENPVFDVPLGTSGTITLKLTTPFYCVDSLTKSFTNSPSAGNDFNLSLQNINLCLDSLVLLGKSTVPVNQFQWLDVDNNVLHTGATFTLSWTSIRPDKLIAINSLGCQDTLMLHIKDIKNIPFSVAYQDSLIFCDVKSKNISPTFYDPSGPLSIKWFSKDASIKNDTSFTPLFDFPDKEYIVYARLKNELGCEKLDSVTLIPGMISLKDPVPKDTIHVCANNDFLLEVKTNSGNYQPDFQWSPSYAIKQGQGTPSVVLFLDASVKLQLKIANKVGCSVHRDFYLKVQTIDPFLDTNIILCNKTPVEINQGYNPSLMYAWSPGFGLSNQNIGNPIFSSPIGRNYAVTVTDPSNQCKVIKEVKIKRGVINPVSIGNDTVVCKVGDMPINVRSVQQKINYFWFNDRNLKELLGSGSSLLAKVKQGNNQFFLKAVDSVGCVLTDSLSIRAVPILAEMPATLVLCNYPDTAIVRVTNSDTLQMLSYDWFPKNNLFPNAGKSSVGKFFMRDTGNIKVIINNQFGCKSELNTTVSFSNDGVPVVFSAGRDSTLCKYGNILLTVNTNIPLQVSWAKSPLFDTIIHSGSSFNYALNRGINSIYVRGENKDKCIYRDTINIRVFPVEASLPATYSQCLPSDTVKIQVSDRDSTQALSYLWSPNGIIKSDPLDGPVAFAQVSKDTLISVLLLNKFGCESTLTTTLILVNPTINITADKETLIKNKGDKAVLKVSGCIGCQYLWSPFNTLSSFTDSIVTAMPNDTTIYKVTASKNQCTTTASIRINVDDVQCDEPNIFVPNAFTPNNDGNNDILRVRGRWITSLRFVVYNRYGQELFSSLNQSEGWDGTYKGKDLGPDVFGYYLSVRCLDGGNFAKRGNVTLIK